MGICEIGPIQVTSATTTPSRRMTKSFRICEYAGSNVGHFSRKVLMLQIFPPAGPAGKKKVKAMIRNGAKVLRRMRLVGRPDELPLACDMSSSVDEQVRIKGDRERIRARIRSLGNPLIRVLRLQMQM